MRWRGILPFIAPWISQHKPQIILTKYRVRKRSIKAVFYLKIRLGAWDCYKAIIDEAKGIPHSPKHHALLKHSPAAHVPMALFVSLNVHSSKRPLTVDCIYPWTYSRKTCFHVTSNVRVSGVKLSSFPAQLWSFTSEHCSKGRWF